jgi:hypothetical protein
MNRLLILLSLLFLAKLSHAETITITVVVPEDQFKTCAIQQGLERNSNCSGGCMTYASSIIGTDRYGKKSIWSIPTTIYNGREATNAQHDQNKTAQAILTQLQIKGICPK